MEKICGLRLECHTSHLTPHTSHLTPHTSHLTPHTSHLTPHTSHLTPHTSHLTLQISFSSSSASDSSAKYNSNSATTNHASSVTHHTSHIRHTAHLPSSLHRRLKGLVSPVNTLQKFGIVAVIVDGATVSAECRQCCRRLQCCHHNQNTTKTQPKYHNGTTSTRHPLSNHLQSPSPSSLWLSSYPPGPPPPSPRTEFSFSFFAGCWL